MPIIMLLTIFMPSLLVWYYYFMQLITVTSNLYYANHHSHVVIGYAEAVSFVTENPALPHGENQTVGRAKL